MIKVRTILENSELIEIGSYEEDEKGDGEYYIGNETCISKELFVNAWMPLPKPYRKEEE